MSRDDWNNCKTCKTELVSGPCDDVPECMAAHVVCPECRKIPCDICGAKRQPEADYGICNGCVKAAVQWVARQARLSIPPRVDGINFSKDPNTNSRYDI